jgi:hypothetical protein
MGYKDSLIHADMYVWYIPVTKSRAYHMQEKFWQNAIFFSWYKLNNLDTEEPQYNQDMEAFPFRSEISQGYPIVASV